MAKEALKRPLGVPLAPNDRHRLEEAAAIDRQPAAAIARMAILQYLDRRGL